MSQAAPVLCINTPTSETTSATRRFRKVGVRNGRQRLGISGDLGMFCSGLCLGLPCFTDDEDQHLQVKICSCPWSLINDSMLFFTPLPIPQRIPCRRQESSTGFPIRTESSVATSMHNKIRVLRVLRYVCLDRGTNNIYLEVVLAGPVEGGFC